jgi:hypothetical protein
MRNRQMVLTACLIAVGGWPVAAQEKATNKQTLTEMRKTVEGLKWQQVDFAAQSPLERCRTLMLLNHALDELDAAAVAEADLAGAFVEQNNLSEGYAKFLGSEPPVARSYEDARKIASALLKGPMSTSRYARELASSDAPGLAASEKVYDTTARRRWESFSETSHTLRKLVAFLKENGKLKEYMTWAPPETARRQEAFEQNSAAQPVAPPAETAKKPAEPAPAGSAEQEQQNRTDSKQAQQALWAVQPPAPATPVVVQDDDDWYPGWYNGAIDNMKRRPHAHPVYRNSEYQAQARARVQQREGGGAKPAGRGGGGRRP